MEKKKISFADFYICYVDYIKKEVVVLCFTYQAH